MLGPRVCPVFYAQFEKIEQSQSQLDPNSNASHQREKHKCGTSQTEPVAKAAEIRLLIVAKKSQLAGAAGVNFGQDAAENNIIEPT